VFLSFVSFLFFCNSVFLFVPSVLCNI
jgi:hypothetical protein